MTAVDIVQCSLEAGEPLTASAPFTGLWLLLEHDAVWGAKALPESNLPEAVKKLLIHQANMLPNARVQFIKRKTPGQTLNFYVAHAHPLHPLLYHFRLNRVEDLLDIDFAALAAARSDHTLSEQRLYVVCTNAKRDICCAKHGLPLVRTLSALDEQHVWQTTHFGGHRFAPTLVCLPHGICYGRVSLKDSPALIHADQQNRILPEYYRGNVAYDAPTQAVEIDLRRQTAQWALDSFTFISQQPDGSNRWWVEFVDGAGVHHRRHVRAELSAFSVFGSTTDPEAHPVTHYVIDN